MLKPVTGKELTGEKVVEYPRQLTRSRHGGAGALRMLKRPSPSVMENAATALSGSDKATTCAPGMGVALAASTTLPLSDCAAAPNVTCDAAIRNTKTIFMHVGNMPIG